MFWLPILNFTWLVSCVSIVIYPSQSESGILDHLPGPVNRTLFYRDRIATQTAAGAAGAAYQESTGKDRFPATMSPRPELRHNHRHRKTFVNLQKGAGRREGLCIERIKMAPGLGSSRIACLGGRTDRQTRRGALSSCEGYFYSLGKLNGRAVFRRLCCLVQTGNRQ